MTTFAEARDIAYQWVQREVAGQPGVAGAFLYGSASTRAGHERLLPTSDVDIKIIVDDGEHTLDPRKSLVDGVVMDVSTAPLAEFSSAEALLGNYYTAIHFQRPNIMHDPSGHLEAIQPIVARDYALRPWVLKRVDHARKQTNECITWLDPGAPLHDQVFTWLLAFFGLTHMILVADLDHPTFRRAPVNTGRILDRYGFGEMHERLLELFGSASVSRDRACALLASCATAFDAAVPVLTTPFFGSSNVSAFARPIAIDGGKELIESGAHRESMIWITLVHNWCQKALFNDAEEEIRTAHEGRYAELLSQLGITSANDVQDRMAHLQELVPEVHAVAEQIVASNPAVRGA